MILGLGCDLENIGRLEYLIKNYRDRFLNRVFSNLELKKTGNPMLMGRSLTKRFAAKEAFTKALGIGLSSGLKLTEIEVLNDSKGKPLIILNERSTLLLEIFGLERHHIRTHLSLSDVGEYALAVVILEKI